MNGAVADFQKLWDWDAGWSDAVRRVKACIKRPEVREHAGDYLRGLLSPIERKNGWQLAEAVGDDAPYALQHLLGRARWDADVARDALQSYVMENLADRDGVLVVDETGFLKKGNRSAGVQRQYSGTAGRVENCQIGVFLAYASSLGHTFLDRALYLPQTWIDDPARCASAGVPPDVGFATKPALAQQMLARALDRGIPAAWVVGDEVYGNDGALRRWLVSRRQPHVLEVSCQHRIWIGFQQVRVDALVSTIPPEAWSRASAGEGSKGPRLYDWALLTQQQAAPRSWMHAILFRRSIAKPEEVAYFAVFAHTRTPGWKIIRAAGSRWAIEECFASGKGEVGLDEYEVRCWQGWYRHITLAMWAHAFLTVQRAALSPRWKKKRQPAAIRVPRGACSAQRPGDPPSAYLAATAPASPP